MNARRNDVLKHIFVNFAFWIVRLICLLRMSEVTYADAIGIHVIQMIIGDGTTNLGYNVISPAYDVALEKASLQFPRVFANNTRVTRYFVPGQFSCEESTGMATAGLYNLLNDRNDGGRNFRVVLSPGCTFEVMAIGDFAREANVPVLASSASVPTPERYPTLLAMSAGSYSVLARALTDVLRRFTWIKFNLLCDTNPDPTQIQAVEVICAMILSFVQTRARDLSALVNYFDSSRPATYQTVLEAGQKQSTVSVLASYTSSYDLILAEASRLGMGTGEYVFLLLPLSPFLQMEEAVVVGSRQVSIDGAHKPLADILQFVLVLGFDEVDWDAVTNESRRIRILSQDLYNWTVIPERQHHVIRLAAYESVLTMAQILDENYDHLENMSARSFASHFASRTFKLPSRTVKTSATGSRLCDIKVKQYRPRNKTYETVLVFDNARLQLYSVNGSTMVWPSVIKFPPTFVPSCLAVTGQNCTVTSSDTSLTIIPATVCSLTIFCAIALVVLRKSQLSTASVAWWTLEESELTLQRQDHQHSRAVYVTFKDLREQHDRRVSSCRN